MNDLNSVLGRLSGPSDSPLSFSPLKELFLSLCEHNCVFECVSYFGKCCVHNRLEEILNLKVKVFYAHVKRKEK